MLMEGNFLKKLNNKNFLYFFKEMCESQLLNLNISCNPRIENKLRYFKTNW